ncbi:TOTE conflict system archaeo-eukaryotic primase domain-containing protein [Paludibaculum fermentans]|uniref:DEAD/DEAH box helicase family protein n=1 Tax=Paludibaculum fermentans TaxID=1473598 RepID=A0A7S7NLJ9_PALFE|nr:DEAD/DEAH box helicase [Paludibaculum fermentans]QOY85848.1 DEAD/DEAH box helicase family protein [Paludibaculum fermentans]
MTDDQERLRRENVRLKALLAKHGIEIPKEATGDPHFGSPKTRALSSEQKIELFRSLFMGRQDVYAVRWESPDGRKGYSPRYERDWKAYYAAPPKDRPRVDKETRKYLPLSDSVVEEHLKGQITVGLYPLLPDDTCWFLAADFDKEAWQEDASAFLAVCREWAVPAALERSRSGNGGHVWIFFEQPISATLARRLGCALLTRAMERRHQIGLSSYDRFFPNQDTMPKGGFGNLIALPLQKGPRQVGNSAFIDDRFEPFADQWAFLGSLSRISATSVEKLVEEAQRRGDLVGVRVSITEDDEEPDPWTLPPCRKRKDPVIAGPLPKTVNIVRANLLFIEKTGLPPAMMNRLLRVAAFQNPEFYKAQSMRLPVYDKPRVIACGEDLPKYLALPRGCLTELTDLLESHRIRPVIRDERFEGLPIAVDFKGTLREAQATAVQAMIAHDDGIVCAPTAFGKTAVAAWLIAHRRVNAIVLVHRQQLLDQWRAKLAMFLGLPVDDIGQIGGGKTARTGRLDVAVIQSLHEKEGVKDFVAEYGHVIVDECHHLSAVTFERVMRSIKAKYVVGLTATPTRKDGHHPIISMQCGPIRFRMQARAMTDSTPFDHIVVRRPTDFRMNDEAGEFTIQDVYAALIGDEARNGMIVADVIRAVQSGRSPLLLTGRTEHLEVFRSRLAGQVKSIFVLKGGLGRKQRKAVMDELASLPETEPRVILATGSYIGEGFDDSRLDTLFLAMPISWKGTLQQYVGRLHRLHDNKRVVEVYDYVDGNLRMLARMYERRLKGYSDMGYRVVDSAVSQQGLPI